MEKSSGLVGRVLMDLSNFLFIKESYTYIRVCSTDNFLAPIFLRILKVWSMIYITGQCGEFRVKNTNLCLHILFWHCFVVFHQKIVFLSFSFIFFDEVSNFRNRILTTQKPEMRTCQWNCVISIFFKKI